MGPEVEKNEVGPDDEKLEKQIRAQVDGDQEAAEEAAAIPDAAQDGHGYPPHVIEPVDIPADDEDAPAPDDESPEQIDENDQPDTGIMEDMKIQLLRLTNGEWILGQFKVVADGGGNTMMAYHKVFRFAISADQKGQMRPSVSPWPVLAGTIELNEISATGFMAHGWDGMNVEELYKQIVSPVAIAGRREMAEELAKKERAERILTAGKRPGNGPRR